MAPTMGKHRREVGGGALKGLVSALLLTLSSVAGARDSGDQFVKTADRSSVLQIDRWSPYIEESSARFGIPEDWIRRVMRAESGGRTTLYGRPITSRAGAMGLMQLMPGTWAEMRVRHGLGSDPHDPRNNILAGSAYLRALYDRFGHPGLFAAYNAGPARYAEHLATGRRLPSETIAYVAALGRAPPRPFAVRRTHSPSGGVFVRLVSVRQRGIETGRPPAVANALFVGLSTASAASE